MSNADISKRDVIVIGTSAGGLEALKSLVAELPSDFSASVFIVWHMPSDQPSLMPQILTRYTRLKVVPAIEGDTIEPGTIYIATPDHHLVVEANCVRVTHGPKENLFRPSIDVLFRSAARAFGSRVIGVVLTGMLDDGASGLYAVKQCGGMAVVQDPVDALFPDMPISAMKAVKVDHTVPIAGMAELLAQLVNASHESLEESARKGDVDVAGAEHELVGGRTVSKQMDEEVRIALEDNAIEIGGHALGEPSMFACPECHGVLTQIKEGPLLRFRCHTGHAYSVSALLSGITGSIEDTLWTAIRAIQESEMLMTHMARHLREAGHADAAEVFEQKVEQAKERADIVRRAVMNNEVLSEAISLPDPEEVVKEA